MPFSHSKKAVSSFLRKRTEAKQKAKEGQTVSVNMCFSTKKIQSGQLKLFSVNEHADD
jgi:hypothetical protein